MPSHIFTRLGKWQEFGRCKPRIAGRRPRLRASSLWRGRGLGSVAARHGLSRIRVPATWAGPCRKRACRRLSMPSVKRRQRRLVLHMQWRPFRRDMPWSEGIGSGGEPFTSVGDNVLVQLSLDKGDDLLCSMLGAARTGDVSPVHEWRLSTCNRPTMLSWRATSTGPIKSRSSVWRRLPCSRTHRVGMRTR